MVVVCGTAFAMPASRGAVHGLADSFSAWVAGDDSRAPGRTADGDRRAPVWFRDTRAKTRLIAETDGVSLFVQKVQTKQGFLLVVALGRSRGVGDTVAGWRKTMRGHAAVVLGHGPVARRGRSARVPLFGVLNRNVARIEIRHSAGRSDSAAAGDGGFVALVDTSRPTTELVAYDAAGNALERVDLRTYRFG